MEAKNNNDKRGLNAAQQSLAGIAALAATGNIAELKQELAQGLNAGLTINEIKEALVQLYAYCGFPRSLNAMATFMALLDDRKANGITDETGKEASPIAHTINKYETGRLTLQALTGREEKGPKTGVNGFAPVIDTFLKEHLFADIFSRDVLNYQQRELVTIAALAAMAGTEPQLQAHIGMGMNTGITASEIAEVFNIIEKKVNSAQATTARAAFSKIASQKGK